MEGRNKDVGPEIDELSLHFQALYKTNKVDGTIKINHLSCETYIPILDDPITQIDVNDAMKDMKKDGDGGGGGGGYDHSLDILNILLRLMLC